LTESSYTDALTLLDRAVGVDPRFSPAYGLIVWCYAHRIALWWGDPAEAQARGLAAAKLALRMSKDDSFALSGGGLVLAMCGGSLEEAQAHIERALALNPNDARAWVAAGWLSEYAGKHERSIECFTWAIRLSPFDPLGYCCYTGIANPCFYIGRYDDAIAWADKALHLEPNFWHALMIKVAAAAMAQRPAALEDATRRLLATQPNFSISRALSVARARSQRELFDAALRKAGLPE
jgi:tetratricopeptide (TPR) repeat protein